MPVFGIFMPDLGSQASDNAGFKLYRELKAENFNKNIHKLWRPSSD